MAKTYEVGGVAYDFPDTFTDDQAIDVLTKQGVIKPRTATTAPTPTAASTAASTSAPAASVPSVPGVPTPAPVAASLAAPGEGLIDRAKKDLRIGWQSGAADLAHTTANVAAAIPIPAVRDFGARAEAYAQKNAPKPQDVAAHHEITDQVLQGVGQVPSQILKFAPAMLSGKAAPLVGGAIGAVGAMDKGWKEALKTGAETAATFYGMDKAGKIKRLVPRAAASAAIMAAPTAYESGGDIKATTAAAITGAAFGLPSHGERTISVDKAREALKGGMDTAAALGDEVQRHLAPQNRTSEAATSAQVLRERLAEMNLSSARADYALHEARSAFDKMPEEEVLNFYKGIEGKSTGATQATPQLTEFAGTVRKVLDDKRDQVIKETGRLKDFYQDYFPHIWKDPEKAADFVRNFYAGKRPLAGGGTRFKERTFPTIEEAMKARPDPENPGEMLPGLELADPNPVGAVLLTVRELDRFLMAKRVIKDLRPQSDKNPGGRDILKFVPEGTPAPRGFKEINDPAFRVSSPGPKRIRMADTTSVTTDIDPNAKGALVTPMAKPRSQPAGRWVAPEAVAQIFNNYLSPGLSQSMIYRGMRSVGNTINQAQLGMSAFHAGFTSVDSAISRFALGIEQTLHGIRTADAGTVGQGLVSAASAPLAPITNAIKGYDLKRALLDPSSIKDPQMQKMVEMAIQAGARADVDPIYRNDLWAKMRGSFRQDKPLLGALQLPGALIEQSAAPLMNHFVPWQKLGVFSDLARFELDKLETTYKGQAIPRDLQVKAMQKAWNSVDNRMGQLVYDNLFWNKTAKDLGMLGIRSVGWNLGTIREVLGGVQDVGQFMKDAATKGKTAEYTHRMAYITAMPMVVGAMGAISNYLFTGEGPQSWKDYIAPRTGRKDETGHDERVWFPSYMKEVYHGLNDPIETVKNKVHPMFSMVNQMLNNEDFYGVEIFNRNDPLVMRLLKEAGYAAGQLSPMSVRNAAAKDIGPEAPLLQKVGTFVGVTSAPAQLKKSAAENLATQFMAGHMGKASRSEDEEETRQALRQINAALRARTDARPMIREAVAKGILSPVQIVESARKSVNYSPLFKDVQAMRLDEVVDVFKAATPAERLMLFQPDMSGQPMIVHKLKNEFESIWKLPRNKQEKVKAEALSILNLSGAVLRGKQ